MMEKGFHCSIYQRRGTCISGKDSRAQQGSALYCAVSCFHHQQAPLITWRQEKQVPALEEPDGLLCISPRKQVFMVVVAPPCV